MTYTTLCPNCKAEGKQSRLKYNLGEEEVFCDRGHKFPTLADAEAISFTPEAEAVQEAAEDEAMAVLDQAGEDNQLHLDAVPEPIAPPPPPPAVAEEKPAPPKKETKQMPAETKVNRTGKATPPTVAKALEKLNGSKIPDSPIEIEGGSLLVTLKIEDQFVGTVKQEAENQGMTVQQHLQSIFHWGLENGWFGILLLTILLFAGAARAQTAKVFLLKPADTAEAKSAWEELQKAQANWDAVQKRIQKDYTLVLENDPDAGNEDVENVYFLGKNSDGTIFFQTGNCSVSDLVITQANQKDQEKRLEECQKVQEEAEKNRPPQHFYRRGWEGGVDFDKDFKFIVPKGISATSIYPWTGCTLTMPYTTSPSIQYNSTSVIPEGAPWTSPFRTIGSGSSTRIVTSAE
jgi:hypothetical protein